MLAQGLFWLKHFLGMDREEGQGLVEYALILVLIAVIVIAALRLTGQSINGIFRNIVTELGGAGGTTP